MPPMPQNKARIKLDIRVKYKHRFLLFIAPRCPRTSSSLLDSDAAWIGPCFQANSIKKNPETNINKLDVKRTGYFSVVPSAITMPAIMFVDVDMKMPLKKGE